MVWMTAYVALRLSAGAEGAALEASVAAVIWSAIGHRAAQASRAMRFAVGVFAVSAITSLGGIAALSVIGFWISGLSVDHRTLFLVALTTFVGAGVWDFAVHRAASAPRRVLLVGGGASTARLLTDLALERDSGLDVVGIVDDEVDESIDISVPYCGPLKTLPAVVRRLAPDLVVVAVPTGRPEVFEQLLGVADAGFQMVGLPEIYEFAFGRLPVEDLTSAWFMSVLHAYNRPANRLAKRVFDIVVAIVGLAVTALILPAIVILVKNSRGPLLYKQQRLGENGRPFEILKFRSMRTDAETAGHAQWASTNDPRVIWGGLLLRRLRIDELPQLWNVLRGEMSIVGPRPERPEFIEHLQAGVPFWTHRHLLRPGITGWAQIRAGYAADALGTVEKLSYDLWYLRHRSLVLDVMICLKTFPRMAMLRGSR
jgi:exopolysaccharide biosynthesis polyprenyl glycosylphosphotransferase